MTPLDPTRKVSHKVLPVLDRKIAAVASSKRKHSSEASDNEEEERSAKKPRMFSPLAKRVPIPLPEGQKRKRGRPRLSSLPRVVSAPPPEEVKMEDDELPLHPSGFKTQGRRLNGRFERKVSESNVNDSTPAGRAQRALERERMKKAIEREVLVKRGLSDGEIDQVAKRGRRDDKEPPLKKVFPKRTLSGRSGNLFSRPNPMSFAARAWAGPLVSDNGSSDDDKGPDTPEDSQSPPALVVLELDEWERGPSLIVTAPTIPPAYKPSPFSFARRRWSSLSTSPVDEQTSSTIDGRPRGMERNLGRGSSLSNRATSYSGNDMYASEEEVRAHFRIQP